MSVLMLAAAASLANGYDLNCRVLFVHPGPVDVVEHLTISTDRKDETTFVRVTSKAGGLTAEPQPLNRVEQENGSYTWLIETSEGPLHFELFPRGSRNGAGTGLLVWRYEMTTIAGLPEDFFDYVGAGVCSAPTKNPA